MLLPVCAYTQISFPYQDKQQLIAELDGRYHITLLGDTTYIDTVKVDKLYQIMGDSVIDLVNIPHSVFSARDSAMTLTPAAQNVWYPISNGGMGGHAAGGTFWNKREEHSMTSYGDTIIFLFDGDYRVDYHLTFSGTDQKTYDTQILLMRANELDSLGKDSQELTKNGSGNASMGSFSYLENVSNGDSLILEYLNESGTEAIVLIDGELFIEFIHR